MSDEKELVEEIFSPIHRDNDLAILYQLYVLIENMEEFVITVKATRRVEPEDRGWSWKGFWDRINDI